MGLSQENTECVTGKEKNTCGKWTSVRDSCGFPTAGEKPLRISMAKEAESDSKPKESWADVTRKADLESDV